MTDIDVLRFRGALDYSLTFAFQKDEFLIAWSLIWFARQSRLISEEERKWLSKSIECLGEGRDRENGMRIWERKKLQKILDQEMSFVLLLGDKKLAWGMIIYAEAARIITAEEATELRRKVETVSAGGEKKDVQEPEMRDGPERVQHP